MRKIIFGAFLVSVISLIGCKENTETLGSAKDIPLVNTTVQTNEILQDLNSQAKLPPRWVQKVKKWFHDHTGTRLFEGCTYSNPCGPCPGLCFNASISGTPNPTGTLTDAQFNNGFRLYGLLLVEDRNNRDKEEIMFFFQDHVNDFTSDNYFYIEDNTPVSSVMAATMGKTKIDIKKGKYPVIFDTDTQLYYALVKSEITN